MASVKKGYSNHEIYILQKAFGKSKLTITRWIKSKNDLLTSQKAKDAFQRAVTNKPERFFKDFIYVINGELVRCLLCDDKLACIAPCTVSKSGTKTKMTSCDVYCTEIKNNGSIDVYIEGKIENSTFIKL